MRWLLVLAACGNAAETRVPAPPAPAPAPAHTISSGAFHSCARTRDGHVACWGQLANGATVLRGNRFFPAENPTKPVLVPGLAHVAGVLAGHDVHCAWTDAGGAWCWGPVGSQETVAPAPIAALHDVVQIAGGAGSRMLCALHRDGRVTCWGDPAWHDHREGERGKALLAPGELHAVPEIFDAVEIAVGFAQACARRKGGLVACWDGFAPAVVTPIGAAAGAISLAGSGGGAGSAFAALLPGGKVHAWQLPAPPDGAPIAVPDHVPADARAISVGGGICVLGSGVSCWAFGATDPVAIALDHPVAVSSGAGASCARLADGSARCWGEDGLRGDGAVTQAIDAVAVPGLADVQAVAIDGRSTCAIANGGKVSCWGARFARDGDDPEDDHPVEVALPGAAIDLALANGRACVHLANHQRYCWGNIHEQLVAQPRRTAEDPRATGGEPHHRKLLALPGVTGVFGGGFARESWTCVADAKDLHCLYTHDGRGETDYYPEQGFETIAGGREAIGVPPGAGTCVRFADGAVQCAAVGSTLVAVPGAGTAVQLAHGPNDAICARRADGTVACWPEELRDAKLGPGPAPIAGATDAIELVGGPAHACIIRADRTLRCWGAWGLVGVIATSSTGPSTVADLAM